MQADQADDVPAAEEQPAPESPPAQEEEKQSSDAFRYEIS